MIGKYETVISTMEEIIYPLPNREGWSKGDLIRYARTIQLKGPHNTGLSHWMLFRLSKGSKNTLVISGHSQDDGRLLKEAEKHLPYNDSLILKGGLTENGNDHLLTRYVNEFGPLQRVFVDTASQFFRHRGMKRFFNEIAAFSTDDIIVYLLG